MVNNNEPEGTHCFYKGQYCKVKNNKVFVYGEWVFTKGITVAQVTAEIRRREIEGLGKLSPRIRGTHFDNS